MLAGVSHDLRTPLSRLRLGLEMSGADAQLQERHDRRHRGDGRIIGQFLDFARAAGGEPPSQPISRRWRGEIAEHYRDTGHTLADEIVAGARA